MEQNLIQELLELKMRYFGSKYFSLTNWIVFNGIKLPLGLKVEDIDGWAEEKQHYLAEQKLYINGIKSTYESMLIDRLDAAAALQERVSQMLSSIAESKDAANIAKTLKTISEIQDEAMKLLKVDAFRSDLYEKNKVSVDNLLLENSKGLPE